ncbi:MAG: ABC transporter permease subunit [Thermoproteota archaeon]
MKREYTFGMIFGFFIILLLYILVLSFVNNPEICNLPYYTFRTFARITVTYLISLMTGLFFGLLAATYKTASTILVPLFDVLQSIPILGYFPAAIIFFVSTFQGAEIGLELAAMLLLYTSMEWAIFFGIVGAVKNIPANIVEAAKSFDLKGFGYIRHVVLPAIVPALISGSTLAWGDGWFFMIAAEYIAYGGVTYSLPGLGSYLAKAAYEYRDMNLVVVLLIMITALVFYVNYLTWHRLTEKAGSGAYKPIFSITWSRRLSFSGVRLLTHILGLAYHRFRHSILPASRKRTYTRIEKGIAISAFIFLVFIVVTLAQPGLPSIDEIGRSSSIPEMINLPFYTLATFTRLTVAYFISLAIALAMGILAAERKSLALIFYPIYDIGQSVPILALFPILFISISQVFGGRLGLEITSITMLVADMIWYLFLNIVAAVKTIPDEIREVSQLLGMKDLQRVRHIVLPAILPGVVTGSMLSWATGWNTVIFSEYMPYGSEVLSLPGLGSFLDRAAQEGNMILLGFLLLIMTCLVIAIDRFVWRKLLSKIERYSAEAM